jgi:hypothetical protein
MSQDVKVGTRSFQRISYVEAVTENVTVALRAQSRRGTLGSDPRIVRGWVVANIPGMLGPHRNAIAPRAWVKSGAATGLMRPVRIPIDEVRVLNSRRLWLPLEAAQAIS